MTAEDIRAAAWPEALTASTAEPRFLSPNKKLSILADWNRFLDFWEAAGRPTSGVHSDIDPSILPVCEAINRLPGIVTLQSCAGHVDKMGINTSAYLWLWLDRRASSRLDQTALELARHPLIGGVERMYAAWGPEITVITFRGEEWHSLADSTALILNYLRDLTHTLPWYRTLWRWLR